MRCCCLFFPLISDEGKSRRNIEEEGKDGLTNSPGLFFLLFFNAYKYLRPDNTHTHTKKISFKKLEGSGAVHRTWVPCTTHTQREGGQKQNKNLFFSLSTFYGNH